MGGEAGADQDEISEVLKEEKRGEGNAAGGDGVEKKENIMEHEKEILSSQRGHGSRLRRTKSPRKVNIIRGLRDTNF